MMGCAHDPLAPALHCLLATHLPPGCPAAANRQAAAAYCTGLALHGCCSRPCEPLAGSCLQQSLMRECESYLATQGRIPSSCSQDNDVAARAAAMKTRVRFSLFHAFLRPAKP